MSIVGTMEKLYENAGEFLSKRIRSLRTSKKWTQQELGEKANIDYKFLGEIERGEKNPSFKILVQIAEALDIEIPELFRFEQEITDRKILINWIKEIIDSLNEEDLQQVLLLLRVLFPIR